MTTGAANRRRGKRIQAKMAKRMNCENVGTLGGEDLKHPVLSIEVKSRDKFVALGWYEQARRNCPAGKIPVVIVHVTGEHKANDLVVMSLDTFQKIEQYMLKSKQFLEALAKDGVIVRATS